MKRKPQISVIIPAYNAADTLQAAVASCLSQEGARFEIIIVDNNSADSTLVTARELASKHNCVTIIEERAQGAAHARNAGVALARGEWLQFLDADDILLPEKWKRQLALTTPNTAWVQGAFRIRQPDLLVTDMPIDNDPFWALTYSGKIGCMNSNLFRRSAYLQIGGMDNTLPDHEDVDLYFRLLCARLPYAVDQTAGCMYVRPATTRTLSQRDHVGQASRRVAFTSAIIRYLKEHRPAYYAKHKRRYRTVLFRHIRHQATHQRLAAVANFRREFAGGLLAEQFDSTLSPRSFPIYQWLGYERTEWLREISRSVRSWFR